VAEARGDGASIVTDTSDAGRPAEALWLLVAAVLTMVGGVAFMVAEVAELPLWLGFAGLALFVAGATLATLIAFRLARRDGVSAARALGRALKTGFKVLWEFAP
jgi:hypothetical protein